MHSPALCPKRSIHISVKSPSAKKKNKALKTRTINKRGITISSILTVSCTHNNIRQILLMQYQQQIYTAQNVHLCMNEQPLTYMI